MSTLWLSFAFKAAEYYAERWQLPLGKCGEEWGKLPPLCDSNLCTSIAMLRLRVVSTATEKSTMLQVKIYKCSCAVSNRQLQIMWQLKMFKMFKNFYNIDEGSTDVSIMSIRP